MKIFITAPFRNGENKAEIEALCGLVNRAGFEDFCFLRDVENYKKAFNDPKELMKRAKEEILKCDALLIDLTTVSTGRAIEMGIAFNAGKKIIIICEKDTALRDTAKGVADEIVEYENLEDIVEPLNMFLQKTQELK